MTLNIKPNRLAREKSPYLLQHAYNPVDWYPWSDEAFENAKRDNKPIFLSIGYSTCHWCHVMERESFEDDEVAEILNKHFVAIKVDREERPDIDHVYMGFCQALTGLGGWPLTIIMTPEKKPLFAGTYFPKRQKYGRRGLLEILAIIAKRWEGERETLLEVGEQIIAETKKMLIAQQEGDWSAKALQAACDIYSGTFDPQFGGFGKAPKFPTPHNLSFLLREYNRTGNEHALKMVEHTLESMYRGGIYDHIGFGFARYSTDERWLVPHFEKMLYDNALLAIVYAEAYQVTKKPFYREVLDQIFTYIEREMTNPEGAFYSAQDADSEGEEGKFYIWSPEEIAQVLGEEEAGRFCELFGITKNGNFAGKNIPNLLHHTFETYAEQNGMPVERLARDVERWRNQLYKAREKREHPLKDDKILTSWNGLMIAAHAIAAKALQNADYARRAERAAQFVLRTLRRDDGRLLARYREGETAHLGYLDDYAFMVWGLLELYEATFNIGHMRAAIELNREMIRLFWDEAGGGFLFTGKDAEALLHPIKEVYDGALPSGNSVAAGNLLRLSRFTADMELAEYAEKQLRAFAGSVEQYPAGYAKMLSAYQFALGPDREVVIAGGMDDDAAKRLIREAQTRFLPNAVLVFCPTENADAVEEVLPVARGKTPVDGKTALYLCENFACQAPVVDVEQAKGML